MPDCGNCYGGANTTNPPHGDNPNPTCSSCQDDSCTTHCFTQNGDNTGPNEDETLRQDELEEALKNCGSSYSNAIVDDGTGTGNLTNTNCPGNGCQLGCADCSDTCGTSCDQNCGSGCNGGCSGCSGSCSGGCSGSCKGSCRGGCQGECNSLCNVGCRGGAMDTIDFKLNKIIEVQNIQQIFDLIVYQAEVRLRKGEGYVDSSLIDELTAWTPEQQEKLFVLYYNIPRLFEDTFEKVLNRKLKYTQSGTLKLLGNKYFSTIIGKDVEEFKHYADRVSALEWLETALELHNTIIPYYDADGGNAIGGFTASEGGSGTSSKDRKDPAYNTPGYPNNRPWIGNNPDATKPDIINDLLGNYQDWQDIVNKIN